MTHYFKGFVQKYKLSGQFGSILFFQKNIYRKCLYYLNIPPEKMVVNKTEKMICSPFSKGIFRVFVTIQAVDN